MSLSQKLLKIAVQFEDVLSPSDIEDLERAARVLQDRSNALLKISA